MRTVAGWVAAFTLPLAASGPDAADAVPLRSPVVHRRDVARRCAAMMTVASDGLACTFLLFGVPAERRNPAADGEVIEAPQHGTASMLGSNVRYVADRGYTGRDGFAIRAQARDVDNVERTLNVRVDVDVRPAPFNRTATGTLSVANPKS